MFHNITPDLQDQDRSVQDQDQDHSVQDQDQLRPRPIFWSQTGLVILRPTVSDHITDLDLGFLLSRPFTSPLPRSIESDKLNS